MVCRFTPERAEESMSNLKDVSQRLAAAAEQFNVETERLNVRIRAINDDIGQMNLGIELWLDGPVFATSPGVDIGCQLGVAKVEDAWQLAIRDVRQTEWGWGDAGPQTALVRASRDVRIEAAPHLCALLTALANEVESRIAKIRAGQVEP